MNGQYGFIIGYRLEGKTPVKRTRFNRKFLGYTDKSQYGKFSYSRDGFMEGIPHRKLLRGVMILRNEDVANVLNFLEQYPLTLHVREVKLTLDDEKMLRGTHE